MCCWCCQKNFTHVKLYPRLFVDKLASQYQYSKYVAKSQRKNFLDLFGVNKVSSIVLETSIVTLEWSQ